MRWVDVRVPASDGSRAFALIGALRPHELQLDPAPPAAGPEWEICVGGLTLQAVRDCLESAGIDVLAARTRVGAVTRL